MDGNNTVDVARLAAENLQLREQLATANLKQVETQRRFEIALRGSPVCIFVQDSNLRYVSILNPPGGFSGDELLGRTDQELYPFEVASELSKLKTRALEGETNVRGQIDLNWLGEDRAFDLTIDPNVNVDGTVIGILGCAVDVSDLKTKQEQLGAALRQMSHRTRNQLSMLLSVVRQTSRQDIPLPQFVRRFEARIEALSITQDLIVSGEWRSVSLRDLVETHVMMGHPLARDRVSIDGPPVTIAPEPAQNLGLALHELATNARQSGSLADDMSGRLSVTWNYITSGEAEGAVVLRWRETAGSAVRAPEKSGFGLMMIRDVLSAALGRDSKLEFREAGVVCQITIPRSCQMTNAAVLP